MTTRPAAIDPNTFKRAASSFPSGVAVVTSGDGERVHGITVSAFASLSLDRYNGFIPNIETFEPLLGSWGAYDGSRSSSGDRRSSPAATPRSNRCRTGRLPGNTGRTKWTS